MQRSAKPSHRVESLGLDHRDVEDEDLENEGLIVRGWQSADVKENHAEKNTKQLEQALAQLAAVGLAFAYYDQLVSVCVNRVFPSFTQLVLMTAQNISITAQLLLCVCFVLTIGCLLPSWFYSVFRLGYLKTFACVAFFLVPFIYTYLDMSLMLLFGNRLSRDLFTLGWDNWRSFRSSFPYKRLFSVSFILGTACYVFILFLWISLVHQLKPVAVRRCQRRFKYIVGGLFFLAVLFAVTCWGVVFKGLASRQDIYVGHNPFFEVELEWSELYLYERVQILCDIDKPIRWRWFPESEEHTGSFDIPVVRNITGFKGKKLFDVKFAEGKKPNIVFVTLESWNAKMTGVIGGGYNNKTLTPNFDRLARKALLFDNFYTNGPQTNRAVLSSLFGLVSLFSTDDSVQFLSKKEIHGLPQVLKKHGYSTRFTSDVDVSWGNWDNLLTNHGVDEVVGSPYYRAACTDLPYCKQENSWGGHDERSFHVLLQQVEALRKQPNPFFLHYWSVSSHHPFTTPEGFVPSEWLRDYANSLDSRGDDSTLHYMQAIQYTDMQLGKFFDSLEAKGLMTNTIFFITGDHGCVCYHADCEPVDCLSAKLYDQDTHVPAMLLFSEDLRTPSTNGTRNSDSASLMDLPSTFTDILGVPDAGVKMNTLGRSLLRDVPSEQKRAFLMNPFFGGLFGVKVGELKYVFDSLKQVHIYNLTDDPGELHPSTMKVEEASEEIKTLSLYCEHYAVSLEWFLDTVDAFEDTFDRSKPFIKEA
eukprot:CAMPEP_0203745512 /NCGR_PEP_ID=MMETSP0098-20131031/1205_1 /ASSEMBLY_ACC=CAM_ASM_000208 /TAXON_ID=96639 /ORGANISM=" , Strain NY0313808BC1" /LENGTH=754 /DNA_ID=CAMNT_0050633311 /DNA_START=62 /DNA_END=2326 /DNA_ORIENTATION=+